MEEQNSNLNIAEDLNNDNPPQEQINSKSNLEEPKVKKKKVLLISLIIFLLLAVVGSIAYYVLTQEEENIGNKEVNEDTEFIESEEIESNNLEVESNEIERTIIKDELFVATGERDVLKILIFNIPKKEVVVSKEILLEGHLALGSANASGHNDSVQYNSKTKDIFFLTDGKSMVGPCVNKDGSCSSRLYKINLDENSPTLLFELDEPAEGSFHEINWIVNDLDNSVLLSFVAYYPSAQPDRKVIQFVKKINTEDGKVIFTKEFKNEKRHYRFSEFVLSKDGKYVYQAKVDPVDEFSDFNDILILQKFDNFSGDIVEEEIFKGVVYSFGTNISSDDNYIAFYLGTSASKLYIYEISTKKIIDVPYNARIENLNLYWSGDSQKLLYFVENAVSYFDISTSQSLLVPQELQEKGYVYLWSPSTRYIVYEDKNKRIKIFDMQNKQVIEIQNLPDIASEVMVGGLALY